MFVGFRRRPLAPASPCRMGHGWGSPGREARAWLVPSAACWVHDVTLDCRSVSKPKEAQMSHRTFLCGLPEGPRSLAAVLGGGPRPSLAATSLTWHL